MPGTPTNYPWEPLIRSADQPNAPTAWHLLGDCNRIDAGDRHRLLGVLHYAERTGPPVLSSFPICTIPLKTLNRDEASVLLLGRGPAERITHGDGAYRSDGETLFGVLVDEVATGAEIEGAAYRIYRRLLRASAELGFPHVGRIWNYLPDINTEPNGLEVYRAFSIGRRAALDDWGRIADKALPAACAIGTHHPGLRVAFLASRRMASTLSNARQQEAYRYPPEYGPKSPAFSRAVLMNGDVGSVHISGTASIRGHRTVHEGNLRRQIAETLRNLHALLRPQGLRLRAAGPGTLLTVYLREAEALPEAESLLAAAVGPEVKRLFLQGDICRRSLLVEIEGIISPAGCAV